MTSDPHATGSRAASPIDFAAESAKTHAHLKAKLKPKITCQRCGHVYEKGACPECWYADSKWGL